MWNSTIRTQEFCVQTAACHLVRCAPLETHHATWRLRGKTAARCCDCDSMPSRRRPSAQHWLAVTHHLLPAQRTCQCWHNQRQLWHVTQYIRHDGRHNHGLLSTNVNSSMSQFNKDVKNITGRGENTAGGQGPGVWLSLVGISALSFLQCLNTAGQEDLPACRNHLVRQHLLKDEPLSPTASAQGRLDWVKVKGSQLINPTFLSTRISVFQTHFSSSVIQFLAVPMRRRISDSLMPSQVVHAAKYVNSLTTSTWLEPTWIICGSWAELSRSSNTLDFGFSPVHLPAQWGGVFTHDS